MATFERELWVRAALDETWAFHSTVDGLRALTPDWLGLRIEGIERPADDPETNVLTAGTRIRASVQPLGVGPRQTWVSHVTRREAGDASATFVDVMEDGPFPEWEHTHSFRAEDGGTHVRDYVEYRAPAGNVGDAFALLGIAPMFWYRHRRTRAVLDGR